VQTKASALERHSGNGSLQVCAASLCRLETHRPVFLWIAAVETASFESAPFRFADFKTAARLFI
jgi:hypothetical protein